MTIIRILAAIAFVSVGIVAKSQDGNPQMEDGEIRRLLPGTWTSESRFQGYTLKTKLQLKGDGSYHEEHRLEGVTGEQPAPYQFSGTWSVKQGVLEKKIAKSNLPVEHKPEPGRVISVNEKELRLASSTEKRKKSDPQVFQRSK
jgi:hypothetical protein